MTTAMTPGEKMIWAAAFAHAGSFAVPWSFEHAAKAVLRARESAVSGTQPTTCEHEPIVTVDPDALAMLREMIGERPVVERLVAFVRKVIAYDGAPQKWGQPGSLLDQAVDLLRELGFDEKEVDPLSAVREHVQSVMRSDADGLRLGHVGEEWWAKLRELVGAKG